MKIALLGLILALVAGCAAASAGATAEDSVVSVDAGTDIAEDASRSAVFDATTQSADVDASACPSSAQRRYVGTPDDCLSVNLQCAAGERTFAAACGCER